MDIKLLSQSDLSDILDKAQEVVLSGQEWKKAFPKVSGYSYFIPQSYQDIEEYPESFRSDDHAIAYETAKYPELYSKIEKLLSILIVKNILGPTPIMSNMYELAGTHYVTELVLHNKTYIKLYTDFIIFNEERKERFHSIDFIRIVRKWDWIYETYYLLFARFFSGKESFDDDLDYLNYNVSTLKKGRLDKDSEKNIFFTAIKDFLLKIGFKSSDKAYNKTLADLFEKMIIKHIFLDKPNSVEKIKAHYLGILNNLEEIEEINSNIEIEIKAENERELPEI